MKINPRAVVLLAFLFCLPREAAVLGAAPQSAEDLKSEVVRNYAALLRAEYEDSLELALQLQTATGKFLEKPGAETLQATREAWIRCRTPYLQTEIARFYDGPIDTIEGFINSWPIDENYIDYTESAANAGIINQPEKFPQITRDVLMGANEREGDRNISTGFHAIEFLLWGQDLYVDGPGRRSYADYIDASRGPGLHAARRREYLRLLTEILVEDLRIVAGQWAPDQPHNYRARFLALPADEALANIFNGLGNLSGAELSSERLLVPYTTRSQENEHSCFSDTTHLDLLHNELGIRNICHGRYTRANGVVVEGPGLCALLGKINPPLAAALQRQLEESEAALKAIPPPFDQAILGDDTSPGRIAIKKSLDALQAQTASIVSAAAALGIRLNLK